MEITLKIVAPEIVKALEGLSLTLGSGKIEQSATDPNQLDLFTMPANIKPPKVTIEQEITEVKGVQTEKNYTIDDLRKIAAGIAKSKGAKIINDLLVGFGVSKLSDLDPQKYSDFMQALEGVK